MILLLLTTTLQAEKMRLAIMELQPKRVDVGVSEMVSDLLRTEMFNTGLFRVIERGEMKAILEEQSFQMTGCTETECAVQMGKLLSARKILVGTVGKLGTKFIINARIVDVEKGEMEFGDKASSKTEEDLEQAVSEFANKLAGRITGEVIIQKSYQPKNQINDTTKPHRQFGISDDEWWEYKELNISIKKYIEKNNNYSFFSASWRSALPFLSGHYYIDNKITGIIFISTKSLLFVGAILPISLHNLAGFYAGFAFIDLITSNIGVNNRHNLSDKFEQFSLQSNLFTPNKNIGLAYRF